MRRVFVLLLACVAAFAFSSAAMAGVLHSGLANYLAAPDGPPPNHPFQPGFLFEAGVRPFTRFPVTGIVWYQGESNAMNRREIFVAIENVRAIPIAPVPACRWTKRWSPRRSTYRRCSPRRSTSITT